MTVAAGPGNTLAGAIVAPGRGLAVHEGYCINIRGRTEICDLCRRACHAGAITLSAEGVTVDEDRCTDCGACVPACPAGAFTHAGLDPENLIARVAASGSGRIACAATVDDAAARIPCHKMLDARLVAALFAEGVEPVELIGTDRCGQCPSGDARPSLKVAARTLAKWFAGAAPMVSFQAGAGTAEDNGPARRRAFLRSVFRSIAPPQEPDFDDLDDFEEAATARPVPFQMALATRRHLLPFRAGGPVGATGRTIGESCSGCMICAELCPTGALRDAGDGDWRAVSFDPALCTNCTLCLKICPMDAIEPAALRGVEAAGAGRSVLFARAERRCAQCDALFSSAAGDGDGVCPSCTNEIEMDAEWLEMLHD